MIRNVRTVYLRSICRALNQRGLSLHAIADGASISIEDLRRLTGEFASTLDGESGQRLISLHARVSGTPSMPQRYRKAKHRLMVPREECSGAGAQPG